MRPWHSLRRKLPLLISTLLGAVVIAVCWSAYGQVQGVLRQAAGARTVGVTQQLALMLEESARRVRREAREVAADSALVTALTHPSATTRDAARQALEQYRKGLLRPASYTLWNRAGEQLLAIGPLVPTGDGRPPRDVAARPPRTPLVGGIGALTRAGQGLMFPVAAPVLDAANDTVGLLIVYRPVVGQGADQITKLIGTRATLLVGNATGDVWTDFSTTVAGPPRTFPLGAAAEYVGRNGQRQLGVAMPIRTTPWLVVVHGPSAVVLEDAREFVIKIAGVALLFVILGALAAGVLSHQVTAPLAEISRAAEDVARGDYTRRVAITRRDELGSLAGSFNSMAAQVQAATRDLQTYADELTTANTELRASEERYRRLVEASHDAICAVDLAGTVTFTNARLAEMLGCGPGDLLGRSLFDFMDPAVAFAARARFARRLRGIAESGEMAFQRRDGTTLWTTESVSSLFDAAGTLSGVLFMLSDITERRAAEDRVRSSERHFRALTENSLDMLAVLDGSLAARYASPAFEQHTGYTTADVRATPMAARIHPDDLATVRAAFTEVAAAGEARHSTRIEYRYRHKDGRWLTLSSVATNLLADPAVEGIVVNTRDVTEQRLLEAQLRQAQKMEAVGQLAGGVAHDFNNLLTVMTSYTGMLLADLPADDPVRADIEEIRRAAERAASLTRQLLAFSRRQVLAPEVLDLNAVVRDMEQMLQRVLREDVRLETALAPRLGSVLADAGQLEQVIVNLAVNACDAMPTGGALTIETADVELDAAYCRAHAEVTPGFYVMLAVSDSGIGMDAATQARIFEPFFTTKAVGQGTGLGLSMVYGIVRQSGGHAAVYSEPGVGTTMKIYLPRDASAPVVRAPASAPDGLHHGQGTVLLVEDEAPVRAVARRVLERAGYTVLEAASGSAALTCCVQHTEAGGVIDLLLTDMVMPEMSGREVAARVRELQPDTRTAFMSGYTEDAVLRQGGVERDAIFIQKPFTPEALTRKVRGALAPRPRVGAARGLTPGGASRSAASGAAALVPTTSASGSGSFGSR